ncbi:roadblock/LC7 domain-containing protein [Streptomyces sp. TE33382]
MSDPASPQSSQWLLENFVNEVPGVTHALLASTDGMRVAQVNLTMDESDKTAATLAAIQGLARGLGEALGIGSGAGVKQVMAECETFSVFLMLVGRGLPGELSPALGANPSVVATCLGVVTEPGADLGHIAYSASLLNASLARHLTTEVRATGTAVAGR